MAAEAGWKVLLASGGPGAWREPTGAWRAAGEITPDPQNAKKLFGKVVHNNVLIHENAEVNGPTRSPTDNDEKAAGPLMLQGDHGPVAYRNLRIRPLGN